MTIRIAGDTSNWDRAVSGVTRSLDKLAAPGRGVASLGGHFTGAAKGAVKLARDIGLAAIGLEAVGQTAVGVGKALLGSNASMEQTRVAFTQLLGSSKAAGDYLKQLQAFAARTPFEFPELTKDAEQMMGMGFSAKAVIPMLTDVGDAIAAMGGGADQVNAVTYALGQMHARGKAAMRRLGRLLQSQRGVLLLALGCPSVVQPA